MDVTLRIARLRAKFTDVPYAVIEKRALPAQMRQDREAVAAAQVAGGHGALGLRRVVVVDEHVAVDVVQQVASNAQAMRRIDFDPACERSYPGARAQRLLTERRHPLPSPGWPAIPWPAM